MCTVQQVGKEVSHALGSIHYVAQEHACLLIERLAVVAPKELTVDCNVAQRLLQIVGSRVGELFKIQVCSSEVGLQCAYGK